MTTPHNRKKQMPPKQLPPTSMDGPGGKCTPTNELPLPSLTTPTTILPKNPSGYGRSAYGCKSS